MFLLGTFPLPAHSLLAAKVGHTSAPHLSGRGSSCPARRDGQHLLPRLPDLSVRHTSPATPVLDATPWQQNKYAYLNSSLLLH